MEARAPQRREAAQGPSRRGPLHPLRESRRVRALPHALASGTSTAAGRDGRAQARRLINTEPAAIPANIRMITPHAEVAGISAAPTATPTSSISILLVLPVFSPR